MAVRELHDLVNERLHELVDIEHCTCRKTGSVDVTEMGAGADDGSNPRQKMPEMPRIAALGQK